jgi:hypothetical protein
MFRSFFGFEKGSFQLGFPIGSFHVNVRDRGSFYFARMVEYHFLVLLIAATEAFNPFPHIFALLFLIIVLSEYREPSVWT